jgi:hypothetical protein
MNRDIIVRLIKVIDDLYNKEKALELALDCVDISLVEGLDDIIYDYIGFPPEG